MISIFALMSRQIRREYQIHVRQKKSWLNGLVFFVIIMIFFPLTMPADPVLERTLGPGVVWIAMLFANLLSAERLFQTDYEEGVMEQWLVSGYPISALVLAKMTVHWGLNLVAMLLLGPIMALLFGFDRYEVVILCVSLLLGTPTIVALCALSAALGTSLQQKGVLMGLVLLPLTIPVMILGSATVTAAMQGLMVSGHLAVLLAISGIAVAGLPFAIAGVIRHSMVG